MMGGKSGKSMLHNFSNPSQTCNFGITNYDAVLLSPLKLWCMNVNFQSQPDRFASSLTWKAEQPLCKGSHTLLNDLYQT